MELNLSNRKKQNIKSYLDQGFTMLEALRKSKEDMESELTIDKVEIYCLACKQKVTLKNAVEEFREGIRGKRRYIIGNCSLCGRTRSQIIANDLKIVEDGLRK